MTTTVKELQKRVNKGAKWLDKNHPDWWKKIVPEKLDVSNGSVCVLGQVFTHFTHGADRLPAGADAYDYGFDIAGMSDEKCEYATEVPGSIVGLVIEVDTYVILDVLWLTKIDERQQMAKAERRAKRSARAA